jgi:hypothetical protein
MNLVVYDAVKMKNKTVWYKVCCRDADGSVLYFPTSRVMFEFVRQDLKERGEFAAKV